VEEHPAGAGPMPLSGLRVLELGTLIAGPFAGRLLADFGAEVIKVEDPARTDPLRDWGNAADGSPPLWWSVQSRGKSCVTLNLRDERGRALLLDLVERSDVLVENLRPGSLERLGLGPDTLLRRNPRLVIARVSGFGQTGPYAGRAGYASVAEAMGGLRHLNGFPGGPPPRSGVSLGDALAALFVVNGVLMALRWRDQPGGTGQVVDVSLMEACFALLESVVPEYAATGAVRGPSGTRLDGIAPSNLFRCSDGTWMVIAANQDGVFRRLCGAMGQPELADDPRFATHRRRGQNQDAIEQLIGDWSGAHESATVNELLERAGVPCGPVNTVADIFTDPQFAARNMLLQVDDPQLGSIVMPGVVPALTASPGAVRWPGPSDPGSHNESVFGELLGLGPVDLEQLRQEGVV
jgi:formyl-CoA transferase